MRELIKCLWPRGWLGGCAWVGTGLLVFLILVRQYISWAGTERWKEVQEMLAREGESLDFRKVAPEAVPDDENFCAIPALKDLAVAPADDDKSAQALKRKRLMDAGLPEDGKAAVALMKGVLSMKPFSYNLPKDYIPMPKLSRGVTYGEAADMKAWANWFRALGFPLGSPDSGSPATQVLAVLSGNDALIGELAAGLSRPQSQWTPSWRTRELPKLLFAMPISSYTVVQKLTTMLCLRCVAAARAGDAAKAHKSVLIALRFNQATMDDPFLIGTLVACGCSAVNSSAVWELCDAHSGTAEDFRKLEMELSRLDFQKSFLYAIRSEVTGAVNATQYLKRARTLGVLEFNGGLTPPPESGSISFIMRVIPDGWFDANSATMEQWRFDYLIKPLRDAGFPQLLAKRDELTALITEHRNHPFSHLDETLALFAMPAVENVCYKVVYAQSVVNEAIAACALERYRIEHGAYPETLDEADRAGETKIPLDVISGKEMGYRKTANARYALWCVGFDGKDDGGKRVLDATEPERTRFADPKYVGDWVWDFPGK